MSSGAAPMDNPVDTMFRKPWKEILGTGESAHKATGDTSFAAATVGNDDFDNRTGVGLGSEPLHDFNSPWADFADGGHLPVSQNPSYNYFHDERQEPYEEHGAPGQARDDGHSYEGTSGGFYDNFDQERGNYGENRDEGGYDGYGDYGYDDGPGEEYFEIFSQNHGEFYYHNPETDEVVWDAPENATIVRYGTGPECGWPYYSSPFLDNKVQDNLCISGYKAARSETGDSDSEFVRIGAVNSIRKTQTMETDISLGPGICSDPFSFGEGASNNAAMQDFQTWLHTHGPVLGNIRGSPRRRNSRTNSMERSQSPPLSPPRSSRHGSFRSSGRTSPDSDVFPRPPTPTRTGRVSPSSPDLSSPNTKLHPIFNPRGDGKVTTPFNSAKGARAPPPSPIRWEARGSPTKNLVKPVKDLGKIGRKSSSLVSRETDSLELSEAVIQHIIMRNSLKRQLDVEPGSGGEGSSGLGASPFLVSRESEALSLTEDVVEDIVSSSGLPKKQDKSPLVSRLTLTDGMGPTADSSAETSEELTLLVNRAETSSPSLGCSEQEGASIETDFSNKMKIGDFQNAKEHQLMLNRGKG